MGVKLRIVIPLTILIIFSSLIKDIEPKSLSTKSRAARNLRYNLANPAILGKKVVDSINDLTTLVLGLDGIIDYVQDDQSEAEYQRNVTLKLDDILSKINNLDSELTNLRTSIDADKNDILEAIVVGANQHPMKEILDTLDEINEKYEENFSDLQDEVDKYGYDIVEKYILPIARDENFKEDLRRVVKNAKRRQYHKTIFQMVIDHSKNKKKNHQDCNDSSTKDKVFFFYKYFVSTVFKGYSMIVLAYQYTKINSSAEAAFIKDEQEKYQRINKESIVAITNSVITYLKELSVTEYNSTYVCDPETWEEGVNYIELKNYVIKKVTEVCFVPGQRDCIPSDIHDSNGKEYIISKKCPYLFLNSHEEYRNNSTNNVKYSEYKLSSNLIRVPSNTRINRENDEDLVKDCLHDKSSDPHLSVRKLSLSPVECTKTTNQVMTSLRFFEKDGIIGLEPQCGNLVNGKIDPKTVEWFTRSRVYGKREVTIIYAVLDSKYNTINLDDFVLPEGEFVSEVQFTIEDPDNEYKDGDYLYLKVQSKKLYDPVKHIWYANPYANISTYRTNPDFQLKRKEIPLAKLPPAFKQSRKTYEMSIPNKSLIKITDSQLGEPFPTHPLVPFFDMNSYNPSQPTPLGGIGLMYKSVPGYAGFLTFKFFSTDLTSYISPSYVDQFQITGPKLRDD